MTANTLSHEERDKLKELRGTRDDSFAELDQAVLEARRTGATLREIADATDMSVSWVQQAIVRADPKNEFGLRQPKGSREPRVATE